MSSRRTTARISCSSWIAPLGGFHLCQPVRHRLDLVLDLVEGGEQRVELHPQPLLPDLVLVEFVGEPALAPAPRLGQAVQAEEHLRPRRAGPSPMAGSSRSRTRSRLARLSRSPRADSSMTSDGTSPLPFRSNRAQQPLHPAARDLRAEVRGRHVLEVVRLVEDQSPVGRQHRRLLPVVRRLAHGEVGGEQVVIHHHHVGLGRSPPGPEQEAPVEEGGT